MTADHVPHMQLRQFVAAEIQRLQTAPPQCAHQLRRFATVAHLHADKHPRLLCIVITIIELRHIARPELFAKCLEAAGLLRNRHREDRLAVFTKFRFFCDKAQPVKVHIGTAGDSDERRATRFFAGRPGFGTGNRQSAGGLEDGAGVFKNILDRRAHRIGVHADHLVDQRTAQAERFAAHLFDRNAVGKQADLRQLDATPGFQRLVHRIGIEGFDADDFDPGPQPFHIRSDAGDQSATADGDKNRIDRLRMLAQDFHGDRALAGNHVGVIVRMHVGQVATLFELARVGRRLVIGIAMQHDFGTAPAHRIDLDLGCGHRHHDGRRAAKALRRECDTLGMVAGGRRDHATAQSLRWQVHHLVVGAAQLEGKHRLHVFALEQDAIVDAPRQVRRELQRRLDRHVVDACIEDAFQIIGFFHCSAFFILLFRACPANC